MSSGEIHRPRRIVEGTSARQEAGPAALPRQADRFQRALLQGAGPARRTDASRPRPAPAEPAPPAVPVPAGPTPAGPQGPAHGAVEVRRSAPAVAVLFAPQAARDAAKQEAQPQGASEEAADEEPDGWEQALVQLIARLCASTDLDIQAWTVTLPMNPRVLPQTSLQLSFSPLRLALRFSTESSGALSLLSRHRESLAALLSQALPKGRLTDIDIDIT
jgi:hypothetical protein